MYVKHVLQSTVSRYICVGRVKVKYLGLRLGFMMCICSQDQFGLGWNVVKYSGIHRCVIYYISWQHFKSLILWRLSGKLFEKKPLFSSSWVRGMGCYEKTINIIFSSGKIYSLLLMSKCMPGLVFLVKKVKMRKIQKVWLLNMKNVIYLRTINVIYDFHNIIQFAV